MKEYIEKEKIDKAIKEMENHIICNTDQNSGRVNLLGQGQMMMLDILKRNINHKRRKAKWVESHFDCACDICSVCGQKVITGRFKYNYCPNCGAEMDEE